MNTTKVEGKICWEPWTKGWGNRWFRLLFSKSAAYRALGFRKADLSNRREQVFIIAFQVARTGLAIPPMAPEEGAWVRRAICFCNNRYGPSGCPFQQAIATAARLDWTRETCVPLMAALLAKGGTVDAVAAAAHLEPLVVEAFAVVFFNRRARRWGRCRGMLRNYLTPPGLVYRPPNLAAEIELLNAALRGSLAEVVNLSQKLGWTFFQTPDRSGDGL